MVTTTHDWLSLLHAVCLAFSGLALVACVLCGLNELLYGAIALIAHMCKRGHFGTRERLTLERLHAREQQRIAVFLPVYRQEKDCAPLLTDIIDTVDYRNFFLFVALNPHDVATRQAVERLAAENPRVVTVVMDHPEFDQ